MAKKEIMTRRTFLAGAASAGILLSTGCENAGEVLFPESKRLGVHDGRVEIRITNKDGERLKLRQAPKLNGRVLDWSKVKELNGEKMEGVNCFVIQYPQIVSGENPDNGQTTSGRWIEVGIGTAPATYPLDTAPVLVGYISWSQSTAQHVFDEKPPSIIQKNERGAYISPQSGQPIPQDQIGQILQDCDSR